MITKENWYTTFFKGLALDLWSNAIPVHFTQAEIDFMLGASGLQPGASVLDIPCGFGRHSLALARAGYLVTGIDISKDYIRQLRAVCEKEKLPITLVEGDLLTTQLGGPFDMAVCMGNSFSYFPYAGMLTFMQKVYEALKPNSSFFVNTGMLAESILPNLKNELHMTVGDIEFYVDNTWLVEDSVLKSDMRHVRGKQEEKSTSYHFAFTANEIKRMFLATGFRSVDFYSGVGREPYRAGDPQAYIVASK